MQNPSKLRFQIKTNVIVFLILNFGSASNYIFQIYFGRVLEPNEYGTLNAVMALAATFSSVALIMPMLITRMAIPMLATDRGQIVTLTALILKFTVLACFIFVTCAIIFMDDLMAFLHLQEQVPIYILISHVCISLIFPTFMGLLQVERRYLTYALSSFVSMFGRLLSAFVIVMFIGGSVISGLIAVLLGGIASLLIAVWGSRRIFSIKPEALKKGIIKDILKYSFPVAVSTILFSILMNIDMLLVHYYLQSNESGTYATAAVLSKIMLYLPLVIQGVMFPETVRQQNDNQKTLYVLLCSLGLLAVVGVMFVAFVALLGEQAIVLLYGDAYRDANDLLLILTAAMCILAASQLIFTYSMALADFRFIRFQALAVAALLLLVYFNHSDSLEIAYSLTGVLSVMMLSAGFFIWSHHADSKLD